MADNARTASPDGYAMEPVGLMRFAHEKTRKDTKPGNGNLVEDTGGTEQELRWGALFSLLALKEIQIWC